MAGKWLAGILTLSVWALAALSATFWTLKFVGASAPPGPIATVAGPSTVSEPSDLARIFGPPIVVVPTSAPVAIAPPVVDPSSRFLLVGVVANRARTGVALISVEGQAARPYRVGSKIDDGYTLKSVATRSATLAPLSAGGTALTLELAPPGSAATSPGIPPPRPALPAVRPPGNPLPPALTPPATAPIRPPRAPAAIPDA